MLLLGETNTNDFFVCHNNLALKKNCLCFRLCWAFLFCSKVLSFPTIVFLLSSNTLPNKGTTFIKVVSESSSLCSLHVNYSTVTQMHSSVCKIFQNPKKCKFDTANCDSLCQREYREVSLQFFCIHQTETHLFISMFKRVATISLDSTILLTVKNP